MKEENAPRKCVRAYREVNVIPVQLLSLAILRKVDIEFILKLQQYVKLMLK